MAITLCTIFFHGLLSSRSVIPAKRAAMFILVRIMFSPFVNTHVADIPIKIGLCGQLSTALQLLGESANFYMHFARCKPQTVRAPSSGTFWQPETAQGIDGSGVLLSLLFLGFDYLWLCIAIVGVIDIVVKRQVTYSLTWWSIVFPTVTLTTSWLELSTAMDSPAFRALTCITTVFTAIAYSANLGFTIWRTLKGDLIFGQSQLEIEDSMMKKAMAEASDRKEV